MKSNLFFLILLVSSVFFINADEIDDIRQLKEQSAKLSNELKEIKNAIGKIQRVLDETSKGSISKSFNEDLVKSLEDYKRLLNDRNSNSKCNDSSSSVNLTTSDKIQIVDAARLPSHITSLIEIDSNTYIVGYSDGGLEVRDSKTHSLLDKLTSDHEYGVFDMIFIEPDTLLTSGKDEYINIWSLRRKVLIYKFKELGQPVNNILLINTQILVLSLGNNSLKFLDLKSFKDIYTINNAHSSYISSIIKINETSFATIGFDKTIKIWSAEKFNEIEGKRITEEDYPVTICMIEPNLIAVGLSNGNINIWNIITLEKESSIKASEDSVLLIKKYKNEKFLSIVDDNVLKVFSLKNKKISLDQSINTHSKRVNSVVVSKFVEDRVFTGSDDQLIKVWN